MKVPQPVMKSSSKKDLWNELKSARDEIEAQQRILKVIRVVISGTAV
jgi:hypothetical protein